ncbi:hypothetical protein BASA61_007856 [Batrachochytrium salamandrivorans]|nr:hypothetical protein BASA61_007856 [Batrachochytrium salamandrivorans]
MKLNACLTSDAWSNIKNEPIVNYMLISDYSTFFLESVSTGEQSHDAKWIAQDMGRVIDSLAGKVCGAVTDNTTTNRSAWSILKKKYPDFSSKLKLQKEQLTENLSGLVQPAPTRWGFLEGVFRKLKKK